MAVFYKWTDLIDTSQQLVVETPNGSVFVYNYLLWYSKVLMLCNKQPQNCMILIGCLLTVLEVFNYFSCFRMYGTKSLPPALPEYYMSAYHQNQVSKSQVLFLLETFYGLSVNNL